MSSIVTPGMILSASVKARCKVLRATRASWVDTRGNNWERYHIRGHHPKTGDRKENHTEANAGRTTESKSVVSGNSVSPFPFCPS
jgi:hypothetical protein